jgi:hypothetical protein
MEVCLGLLNRKNCLRPRSVSFRELLKDGGLKQEDHRQTLEPLAMMAEGEPGPQLLVADEYSGPLQHVLDGQRKRINPSRPRPLSDRNLGGLADLVRDFA